ncbi:disks large-associated protein 1 [Dryobates pubescens]|uniref:disks large-associated protein 1 n=1 Tax=Dryobates pubescens TaxID=118200 RepID=UPI0023B93B90|nr:disks large-associated protein 1 [Dryobates pubescens]
MNKNQAAEQSLGVLPSKLQLRGSESKHLAGPGEARELPPEVCNRLQPTKGPQLQRRRHSTLPPPPASPRRKLCGLGLPAAGLSAAAPLPRQPAPPPRQPAPPPRQPAPPPRQPAPPPRQPAPPPRQPAPPPRQPAPPPRQPAPLPRQPAPPRAALPHAAAALLLPGAAPQQHPLPGVLRPAPAAAGVSSCITTYKKTPPPVPPRTTTKPFISITAQSSTESAQDAYMDGHGPRGDIISQSGLSNSTESLDSMKALTAAIEAANAQIHGPASQHLGANTATVTTTATIATVAVEDRKKDLFKKNRCLSIGIQVDGAEECPKSGENKASSKFQSIGVQVEEEKCFRRFTRSNSVTAAVQADLDFHENFELLEPQEDNSCPGPASRQFSRDASTSTVSIQGSGNHYHACAVDDDFETDFDPSILPPPDPWIDSITEDPLEAVQRSVCPRDGHWFLKLLQAERDRMEGWCQQMEREERESNLPEDILGKIRTAVGSAQLLMAQKFYQFRELCEENLNPNAHPRPTSQDLAGFWDMLQLSIENISMKFDELHQLKANNWKQMDPHDKKERRVPPPVPKKPSKGQVPLIRERSLESSQRQEARKRLVAAKRAASVRQNSATESAESIEIYIPEAQTRL